MMFRFFLLVTLSLFGSEIEHPPSLHVLIATVGNPTLFQMLESLRPQLEERDYLTIVYDAQDRGDTYGKLSSLLEAFKCHSSVVVEPVNLGYWGHGIRNKHNRLSGDFILHADDDDIYLPNAFEIIRKNCKERSTLYIFQAIVPDISIQKGILIKGRPFQKGHVTTGMGAVPSAYNSESTWGYIYGGDFDFYDGVRKIAPKMKYVHETIYQHRPNVETVYSPEAR